MRSLVLEDTRRLAWHDVRPALGFRVHVCSTGQYFIYGHGSTLRLPERCAIEAW
jgi:hypothetical protein